MSDSFLLFYYDLSTILRHTPDTPDEPHANDQYKTNKLQGTFSLLLVFGLDG